MALHPQVASALKMAEELNLPALNTQTPEAARAAAKANTAAAPTEHDDVHSVRDTVIPGPGGDLPIRIYTPSEGTEHSLIVWFHGGGWVIGSIDSHDGACRSLCVAAGCVVVSVGRNRKYVHQSQAKEHMYIYDGSTNDAHLGIYERSI